MPPKHVGFAPPPEEDLHEHHQNLKAIREEKVKSHPFHRVPPELSYLEHKGPGPKPLSALERLQKQKQKDAQPASTRSNYVVNLTGLKFYAIKEAAVQNKATELNFNYPDIELPVPTNTVLVDVKYASFNSFDWAKVGQFGLNVSETKIGLGYEFAGIVVDAGKSLKEKYPAGTPVFGTVAQASRRGSLATNIVVNPSRDVLVQVDEETLRKLENCEVELKFGDKPVSKEFEIGNDEEQTENTEGEPETTPQDARKNLLSAGLDKLRIAPTLAPLAKLSTFPVLFSRAKQALSHSGKALKSKKANILINGADSNLGFTLIQALNSYELEHLNLILITRESSASYMRKFVHNIGKYDPTKVRNITIIPFDMVNEDLILPGETPEVVYKKLDFFAGEILEAMFSTATGEASITAENANDFKLDLVVDIAGSKKLLQKTTTRFDRLDLIQMPFLSKIDPRTSLSEIFQARTADPLFVKLLKPKKLESAFVSMCKYTVKVPSYSVDELYDNSEVFKAWSGWTGSLANQFVKYNYFDETILKVKKVWLEEALRLVLDGQLQFRIDGYVDWRNGYKEWVKQLRQEDGKVVFEIEDF